MGESVNLKIQIFCEVFYKLLIKLLLQKKLNCDIFYIVERLGAPLTQAFGTLMGVIFCF
jgi:hypothetical protein